MVFFEIWLDVRKKKVVGRCYLVENIHLQLLVGGIPTPLKDMSSSFGMIIYDYFQIFPIYQKTMFQSTKRCMLGTHTKSLGKTHTKSLGKLAMTQAPSGTDCLEVPTWFRPNFQAYGYHGSGNIATIYMA